MWRLLQQPSPDDFVIATGAGATVRDFCDASFSYLGLDFRDFVEVDPRYTRPTEVDALIGQASKAEKVLGWKAKTHWKELVEIMVNSDLERISYNKDLKSH